MLLLIWLIPNSQQWMQQYKPALNLPVVKTYLIYAGLGIDYILTRARSWLKPGDLVLLPLEYEHYTDDGKPTAALINYLLARDPKYLLSLNLINQFSFISGIPLKRVQERCRGATRGEFNS
ncbi:MAG: hypothetical protein F6K65_07100 [Moorea sp. SIO3C2]|nr:hypothetical protein [Moorena sp. SIO3C2]